MQSELEESIQLDFEYIHRHIRIYIPHSTNTIYTHVILYNMYAHTHTHVHALMYVYTMYL